ncbi:MAG: phosphoethanolamine transferase [Aestuariibaculum sp.]
MDSLLTNTHLYLMEVIKKYRTQIVFHLLLNLIILVFVTYSTFYHIPLNGWEKVGYLFFLLLIQFTVFGFVYFLSLNRILFVILFPIAFIICGISSFWVYTQDIIINEGVIQATLETKSDIVADLISFPLILYIISLIIVTVFILKKYYLLKNNTIKSPLSIFAVLALTVFLFLFIKRPMTFDSKSPYNIFIGLIDYYQKPILEFKEINIPITSSSDTLKIILILGESVRADHLSLNGYNRNTTPLLEARDAVISFPNIFTSKTYTGESIPQILTNQSINDSISTSLVSLIDVFNKAKIQTIWIGNQTPEKSYLHFIKQCSIKKFIDPYHSYLTYHKDLDEKLLPYFDSYFQKEKKQLIIFHTMGSHWFYENRYRKEFQKFEPVMQSKFLKANTEQEIINSYDNTIVYFDYFLDSLIQKIEETHTNTLVVYLSDHGESLGENGIWLHGQEATNKNPAMVVWFPREFIKRNPNKTKNLLEKKNQNITTDFLFHSFMDIFKIEGISYQRDLSLFKQADTIPNKL